ncbi:MAG: type II secretion system protein GspL [Myxococcota bacterium]
MMKTVLGLDFGSHSVKAVELRQTLRGVEPVQLRVHPLAAPDADMEEQLRRFAAMHRLPFEQAICALPGDRITSRRLEFPFRDRKKLQAAVPFELEAQTPFDSEDVVVDWTVLEGDRHHASVQAVLVQREEVSAYLEKLQSWGCSPRTLEAEGLVLGNLAAIFDLPGTRLLVDLGHRKTTFCLLMDGRPVAARTITLGGAALTEAVAKDRNLPLDEAERVKCEDGVFHLGFDSASPASLAVLDRLARETVRTLESLEPVLGGPAEAQVASLVLFGGTARLHRIDEYLAERTGIPTARLAPPPEAEGASLVAGGDPLLFAPALALALRGTGEARSRLEFRRDEFAYRTDLRRFFGPQLRATALLLTAVLVLLGARVVTSVGLESRRADQLYAQLQGLYTGAFPDQPAPDRPVMAMRRALTDARERADFLGIYGNGSALDLLAELSRRVPPDLPVRFEEITIDRNVIRIKVSAEGFEATDRLERVIAASPPFTSAKAGESSTDRRSGRIEFDLIISLDEGGEGAP